MSISFAALLCSRLCHDLVSPVGALANGVEILADEHDEDMRQQVLKLLEDSARQTSNRLQFFRLAFGSAGGFGATIDPREGHKALAAFFGDSKVTLDWRLDLPVLDKDAMKLLLNLALIGGESLIRGGTLRVVSRRDGEATVLEVTAEGDRLILPDATRTALAGDLGESDLEPRTAPAYLAAAVAREIDAELTLTSREGCAVFTARLA